MPYVTGSEILAKAGVPDPDTEATEWADLCAAALEAEIAHRLDGVTPTASDDDELTRAAILDGMACYADRDAPHGLLTLSGDGTVSRLGRSIIRALEPVLFRIGGPGIG